MRGGAYTRGELTRGVTQVSRKRLGALIFGGAYASGNTTKSRMYNVPSEKYGTPDQETR